VIFLPLRSERKHEQFSFPSRFISCFNIKNGKERGRGVKKNIFRVISQRSKGIPVYCLWSVTIFACFKRIDSEIHDCYDFVYLKKENQNLTEFKVLPFENRLS
jgi:hypothetical protein